MNKLLIHNNNTLFNREEYFRIVEQFVFDVDLDKDVDFYIDENLASGQLKDKLVVADIVFIKVSLSQNYLEYLGLRLAYHIRLTKSLGAKSFIPIIFIAEESFQFLGMTYKEPSILFTKGIYIIKETSDELSRALNWYNSGKIKSLDDSSDFTKSICITPPANYRSHHSIANEWSILRWAKVIGIKDENDVMHEIKSRIECLLYYKYLQAKYPLNIEPSKTVISINERGRILLIDDEWEKGWSIIFESIFAINSKITFETLKFNFKDKSPVEIIEKCRNEVSEFNPDLIILDLRLSDDDFKNTRPDELTGLKILNEIKSINPGIQVLIFTASNKVWNLVDLQKAGADGFVLKESPENSVDNDYTKHSIIRLASEVTLGLKRSFLKKVYLLMQEIRNTQDAYPSSDEKEFFFRTDYNLELAFKLLSLVYL